VVMKAKAMRVRKEPQGLVRGLLAQGLKDNDDFKEDGKMIFYSGGRVIGLCTKHWLADGRRLKCCIGILLDSCLSCLEIAYIQFTMFQLNSLKQ